MLFVKVRDYLAAGHVGEKNAISSKELGKLVDCSSREIRDCVNLLRKMGVPICSSNKGYWFAVDDAEIRQTMMRLKSWIDSMETALNGLEKCLSTPTIVDDTVELEVS